MNYNFKIDEVIKYFYEISKIPRKSGNEEKISEYIQKFAKDRNLKYVKDDYNNVIIFKDAQNSNCTESIILQSHLDMVCEKEITSKHNFEKDGLDIYIDGDYLKARGTTLGADNGIGVAIILAILDSKEITHPPIEAIFTVAEETTMLGAQKINTSMLKGNKMICLDNMNEKELWTGCASAKIIEYEANCQETNIKEGYKLITIGLDGFKGGHSGKDINKPRGNPIIEMGMILKELQKNNEIYIKNLYSRGKVNVIPRECYCDLYIEEDKLNNVKETLTKYKEELSKRITDTEDLHISINELDYTVKDKTCANLTTTQNIIKIINTFPNGVYYTDQYNNPLVSLNVGVIEIKPKKIYIGFSIRSNRKEIENKLLQELKTNIEDQFKMDRSEKELSGYEHLKPSEFINKCVDIYKEQFNTEPRVIDMHICLEAGFFAQKIPELDFIAIAPDILDAHSPNERCSISSLERVYNYIILILKKL